MSNGSIDKLVAEELEDTDRVPQKEPVGGGGNLRCPRVLLVMWWIPHYRVPIFRLLSRNPAINFTVAAGDNTLMIDGSHIAGADADEAIDINWRRITSRRVRWPIFRNWEWQPDAVRMIMHEPFDLVIAFGNRSLSTYLVKLVCKVRNIPVMEWSQGVVVRERGLKLFLRKLYMRQSDALLLYSDFARNFFIEQGISPDRMYTVHNSLDHDRQVMIRDSLSERDISLMRESLGVTGPEGRLIVHSGRLEAGKNLPFLFDALGELHRRGYRVTLVLVGGGRDEFRLRNLAQEHGIADYVVFYGACYDEDTLARMFTAADLSVVPGKVGLIAMHMLVYGTPILTNDGVHGPEIEAIREGETGAYYRDGDIGHLVERMTDMLYPFPVKPRMQFACMDIVDSQYTPEYQESVIVRAIGDVLSRSGTH